MSWIKLHRQTTISEFWDTGEPFDSQHAFIHVLLSANWRDGKMVSEGQVVDVKRGQWMTSIRKLSNIFHWSRGKVVRWISVMKKLGMLDSENVKCGTLLTVVNYGKYQDERDTYEPPTSHLRDTYEPPTDQIRTGDEYIGGTVTGQQRDTDGTQYKKDINKEQQTIDVNASVNAREAGSGPEAVPARREEVGAKSPYPSHDDDDEDDDCLPPEEAIARWLATHPAQTTS